jgi:hypothetical protein
VKPKLAPTKKKPKAKTLYAMTYFAAYGTDSYGKIATIKIKRGGNDYTPASFVEGETNLKVKQDPRPKIKQEPR